MKFLGLAANVNSYTKQLQGTHMDNLKSWWPELEAAGYLTITSPWARITPAGAVALEAHRAAGGRVAK